MVLQIVFRVAFSQLPGGLGHFADCICIPLNRTTTLHLVLTVTILLTYFPSLVGRLFQRCHSSRIDEVLTCGDSMIKPHMLSRIPSSCLQKQLSVLVTVPRILISFLPCHVKILFYMEVIVSTVLPSLTPLRIDDSLWIHIHH